MTTKRNLQISLFLFSTLFGVSFNVYSQIPNFDFECWTFGPYGNIPCEWATSNDIIYFWSIENVFEEQINVQSGFSSVKLKSSAESGPWLDRPGAITNGYFNPIIDEGIGIIWTIGGGTSINSSPEVLSGYAQYAPIENDTAFIQSILTKYDPIIDSTIEIARGNIKLSSTEGVYLCFNLEYKYLSTETPDTILIGIFSSLPENPIVGSVLYIDSLNFSPKLTTGLLENSMLSKVAVGPNPAATYIDIQSELRFKEITIYDVTKHLVYHAEGSVITSPHRIDTSKFPSGLYLVNGELENGNIFREKIIIQD